MVKKMLHKMYIKCSLSEYLFKLRLEIFDFLKITTNEHIFNQSLYIKNVSIFKVNCEIGSVLIFTLNELYIYESCVNNIFLFFIF